MPMDRDRDAELQQLCRRAENYLFELLNNSPSSPRDTARGISRLAFQGDNPVQQLFLAAASKVNERASSPPETAKPRAANKALSWLARGRKDSSADKPTSNTSAAAQARLQGAGLPARQARPDESRRPPIAEGTAHPPPRSSDSTDGHSISSSARSTVDTVSDSQSIGKAGGVLPYNCILCQYDLSSKGVCKRHLEDQHVSPKTYECEKCRKPFDNKAEAKKHAATCGAGIFYFLAVRPEAKKMYACEFTGDLFLSLKTYVDHLVRLSERREDRPKGCLHRKLRALLSQQDLRARLQEASVSLLDSPDAWQHLVWPQPVVTKTIKQLEMATVSSNESIINFPAESGQREDRDVGMYLGELLRLGKLERQEGAQPPASLPVQQSEKSSLSSHKVSNISTPSTTFSNVPTPMSGTFAVPPLPGQMSFAVDPAETQSIDSSEFQRLPPPAAADPMTGVVGQEQKPKRPLSGQSSMSMPHRQPPGPPLPNLDTSYNFTNPSNFFSPQQQADAMEQDLDPSSLPYRNLDMASTSSSINFSNPSTTTLGTLQTQNTSIIPDTASDTTYAQSYREPELISQQMANASHFDTSSSSFWPPQGAADTSSFTPTQFHQQQQQLPESSGSSGFQMIPSMFDFNGNDFCAAPPPPDQNSMATTAENYAGMLDDKMAYDLHSGLDSNGNMGFFMQQDDGRRQ